MFAVLHVRKFEAVDVIRTSINCPTQYITNGLLFTTLIKFPLRKMVLLTIFFYLNDCCHFSRWSRIIQILYTEKAGIKFLLSFPSLQLVCGGLAGSTVALLTTPFDVVKTRLQTQVWVFIYSPLSQIRIPLFLFEMSQIKRLFPFSEHNQRTRNS